MLSESTKKYLNWAGFALSILAVYFVIFQLRQYAGDIDFALLAPVMWILVLLSFAYAASNLLLTASWRSLLAHLGVSVSLRKATHIYGISLLAKYIPGNIFQFVGRQAIGVKAGLPGVALLKSTLWEVAVLAGCGSLFVLLLLNHLWPTLALSIVLAVFLISGVLGIWFSGKHFSTSVARAIIWDLLFLALSGAVFFAVIWQTTPATALTAGMLVIVIASYVIAWLAGLLTPGAPAGLGIREVVLLALLAPVTGEAQLLAAIVIGRLITICGDLLFYLLALSLGNKRSSSF